MIGGRDEPGKRGRSKAETRAYSEGNLGGQGPREDMARMNYRRRQIEKGLTKGLITEPSKGIMLL
jgi:hypothetical protein